MVRPIPVRAELLTVARIVSEYISYSDLGREAFAFEAGLSTERLTQLEYGVAWPTARERIDLWRAASWRELNPAYNGDIQITD